MVPRRAARPERPALPPVETGPQPESLEQRSVDAVPAPPEQAPPAMQETVMESTVPVAVPSAPSDPQLEAIEETLSAGLQELFQQLPPHQQQAFKQRGEEVAQTILTWQQQARLVAQKVLQLIRSWLQLVPRISPYYLEQESKIKTDHIMALAAHEEDDSTL